MMQKSIAAISLGMMLLAPVFAFGAADGLDDVHNRCIVRLVDSVASAKVDGIAHAFAARGNASLKYVYSHSIKGFTVNMPCHAAQTAFGDSALILSMEPDAVVSINKKPSNVGGGKNSTATAGQTVSYGTLRVGGPQDGTGHTAWIIDTGVDLTHPDLNVDASRSYTVFSRGDANDQNGHGTHVAGIIGAEDNDIDSLGVAPNTTIVPVRVLDRRGSGSISGVIAGVDYVAANARAGDCVNMSLGGPVSPSLDSAVLDASNATHAFFTIAAGNDGAVANNTSPARVNGTYVYTVSAVGQYDAWAYFSNYGNPPVDYAAPGVNIFSLWKDGGTNTISGTSMAAPHACAVLMLSGGHPATDSTAIGDPDGYDDPIIHLP
jgi:hypothetical protein